MSKNNKLLLLLSAVLCVAGTTGVLAQYTADKEVENNIATDTVDIELNEYQQTSNGEELFVNPTGIIPGATVSKIPRVSNKGSECWIRAKFEFNINDEYLEPISLNNITGFDSAKWVESNDGYYYYTSTFAENDEIELFKAVNIPPEWGNEYKDKIITIDVTTEAIQVKNFNPNFSSEKPWGNEEVEECVRSRDFERSDK